MHASLLVEMIYIWLVIAVHDAHQALSLTIIGFVGVEILLDHRSMEFWCSVHCRYKVLIDRDLHHQLGVVCGIHRAGHPSTTTYIALFILA